MIEGSAAAQPSVQDNTASAHPPVQETLSAAGEEEVSVSAEEAAAADGCEISEGPDIPDAEFEEVSADTPSEEKTE